MRKALKKSNLNGLAVALTVTLAVIGCTTNRTPGQGEPYIGGPGLGPSAPTSNVSSSRSTTVMPPPMTSSYQRDETLTTTVITRSASRLPLTADQAAAVIAGNQPRVRVLGPSNPGVSGGYHSDAIVTGQVVDSAAAVNPQQTINSSISSPGVDAISSGAGGATVTTSNGVVISGNSITANSTTGAVTTSDAAAPVFTGDTRLVTPTNAAIPLTPGAFAGGAASPRTTVARTTRTATPTTASGTGTSTVNIPVRATTINNSTVGSGSVKAITANGRVVVTNTSTTSGNQ